MLEVEHLRMRFGGKTVLDDLSLTVEEGEVVAVLGPSGSGKSTLLRVVAGLERPESGEVTWRGRDLAGEPPHRRNFGLMFQDYALFPHKDVAGNVAFGLRMAGIDREERERRVAESLTWVGLAGLESRAVQTLSGGEQQRVALARALAPRPELLMLDEPLGSLDRALRDRLALELKDILATPGLTGLYVTHDQEEAFTVADRVAVLHDGSIVQMGTPEEVWNAPADEWMARFLGLTAILPAEAAHGVARTPWGTVPLPSGTRGRLQILLRPEGLSLAPASPDSAPGGPAAGDGLAGTAGAGLFRGGHRLLEVLLEDGPTLAVEVSALVDPRSLPAPGQPVRVDVDPRAVVILG